MTIIQKGEPMTDTELKRRKAESGEVTVYANR